ncbi:MAG: pyridoxal-phosphate dependent enzyme [Gammaproteobacteria bacterium]|nr:pyridoxal-phosphate dependent enzyme [Gammaproteobacteria bacterium]
MVEISESILSTIGNTPVVRTSRMAPPGVDLFVKLEAFNPMGSVKDRLALGVIEHAERTGKLKPGQTVVEGTSGNTGIGLAMVCARKGYPLVVTMAENFSVERRRLMRFLGAKVVLTPASEMGSGMMVKARELAETHGWFLCHQFENEANADIHSETTALEILEAFADRRLDYWVTGYGTGGTLKGVARVLREKRPETRIVVCEPDNSQLLAGGVSQKHGPDGPPELSHPAFRPHLMQGWTPDFISKLVDDAVEAAYIDQLMPVKGTEALRLSKELARKEGIFTGISGGATFAGALELCKSVPDQSSILCMLPDTGERYLSTALFEEIPSEMTLEEIRISKSTPVCRFDAPPPAPPEAAPQRVTEEARQFVVDAINDNKYPVVMFALEWCEFCWSVRKLFAHLQIPYRSIDLDSVNYQEGDQGGKILAALNDRTRFGTIPQIFIGNEFLGGCTDFFDAFREGRVRDLLDNNQVEFDRSARVDPYGFFPTWLHPR